MQPHSDCKLLTCHQYCAPSGNGRLKEEEKPLDRLRGPARTREKAQLVVCRPKVALLVCTYGKQRVGETYW